MAELFIELFSEEIPAKLQIDARKNINEILCEKLQKKEIKFKSSKFFSTPKRLVFYIDGISEQIEKKKKTVERKRNILLINCIWKLLGHFKLCLKKKNVISKLSKAIKKYLPQTTWIKWISVLKCFAKPSIIGKRIQADKLRSMAFINKNFIKI